MRYASDLGLFAFLSIWIIVLSVAVNVCMECVWRALDRRKR